MEWFILAVVSWILLLLLVDWSALKKNIWCGVAAVLLQRVVDGMGVSHGLYELRKFSLCFGYTDIFFDLGPVLVVGTLIAQYHPKTRIMRILNVIALTLLYTLQEMLLFSRGNVVYKNWHFADSVGVNFLAMIILSWFAIVVLNKGEEIG